jgi:hypothetical protein
MDSLLSSLDPEARNQLKPMLLVVISELAQEGNSVCSVLPIQPNLLEIVSRSPSGTYRIDNISPTNRATTTMESLFQRLPSF